MGEQEQLRRKTAPSWPLSQHVLMVIDCWTLKLHGWPHHISVYLQGGGGWGRNSTVKSMSSALCRLLFASISFNCRTGIQWAETVPQMLLLFNNTPAAAFAQLGAQRCRPCEECLCLGHIWRFFCGFQGLRLPFLWLSVVPDCKLTAVHQIRALEEECYFRWESIFPFLLVVKYLSFKRATAF